jgi:hypothetical protein
MSRQFTKDEAREILALAAERSHAARSETTARLTLAELEEAARAAGIDPAHVRSAAADALSPGRRAVHRTFLGVPVEVRRTRTLSGPFGPEEWTTAVEEARREFGKRGVVTDLGRTREWASHPDERQAPVRVIAEPIEGGTRLTAERNTWSRALGVALGAGSNLTVAVVLGAVWLASGADSVLWAPALLLAVFAAAFAVVGLSKLRKKGREEAEAFDRVLRSVSDEASERLESTATKSELPRGTLDDALAADEHDSSELNSVSRGSRTRV